MRSIRVTLAGTAASLVLIAAPAAAQPGSGDHEQRAAGKVAEKPAHKAQKPGKTGEQGKAAMPEKGNARTHTATPPRPAMVSPVNPGNQPQRDTDRTNRQPEATPGRTPRPDVKRVSYTGPKGTKVVVPTNDRVHVITRKRAIDWAQIDRRASFQGCPLGLAKKYTGCTPPGLDQPPARAWMQPSWYWPNYNRDYRFRYADGYMLRLGSGTTVLSYVPLLGGALAVGQIWPTPYQSVDMPGYYDRYYDLGSANAYRYYGDTIYRVDPDTAAIQSVVALLTGNDIVIGQPMPPGYEVYNVPYGYRDQYYDTSDAMYRYSDGYIYQLDPATRLVQAAIELLG
ncbi:hypothetical protein [Novosphingobium mangrovi (ex Huang et al. 2023)]|uniref:RcnB family protein n=1 Tax=Novosphingobium mangrovi (ex Huang et al. 2023) TaxID=2976432 RepID=A0ABT2I8I4_9SPHN|nr:hypothetical protein [Novosphingobium mangrovi (ex Huang et al. 2023)]MCT2401146.1 hypothetical protein [Novosphingobium mangrovi (ex Huang et al. 2023)]